jgi:hypothetical protein
MAIHPVYKMGVITRARYISDWGMVVVNGVLATVYLIMVLITYFLTRTPFTLDTSFYRMSTSIDTSGNLHVNTHKEITAGANLVVYIIMAYLAVSTIMHTLYAVFEVYSESLDHCNSYMRWIDYAISNSLILVCMALLAGVRDLFTISMLVTNNIGFVTIYSLLERNINTVCNLEQRIWAKPSVYMPWLAALLLFVGNYTVICSALTFMALDDTVTGTFIYYCLGGTLLLYTYPVVIMTLYIFLGGSYRVYEQFYLWFSALTRLYLGFIFIMSVQGILS